MWSSRERGVALLAAAIVAGLGVLLLVGAGPLARSAPARGSASGVEPLPPPTRSSTATAADLVVTVSVTPNRPGANAVTVQASSSRRPPPAAVDGVAVEVAGGAGRVLLALAAPETFAGTVRLAAAGPVRITAVVSRAGQRITVPVAWSVDQPLAAPSQPASGPVTDADPGLRSVVDLLAAPLLGALILVGWRWSRRRRRPGPEPRPEPEPASAPEAEPEQAAEPVLGGVP